MSATFTSYAEFRQRYPIQFGDDSAWLGTGTYGKVMKVEDQVETEWVAIKISEYRHDEAKSLKAEVELAQKVPRHVNIARYDACYRLETEVGVSDFAIMKYYPEGNLADLLKSHRLSDGELRELVSGILEGLKILHQRRIVHRDFKPANILISRDNRRRLIPKIADFGLSKYVGDDEIDSSDFDLSDGRGTPSYKAPEQIVGGRVSFNLDLWAFGVILYEMMTGEKPFSTRGQSSEHTQRRELERRITTVQLPDGLSQVPEPFQSMIRLCLVKDIRQRVRKPDELLAYLEKPTMAIGVTRPIPTSGPVEEATDVYVAPKVPHPNTFGHLLTERRVPELPRRVSKEKSFWSWVAMGGGMVLVSLLVWNLKSPVSPVVDVSTGTPTEQKATVPNIPASHQQELKIKNPSQVPTIQASMLQEPAKEILNKNKDLAGIAEKETLRKKQFQAEYDELIQKGNELINSANNKAGAMDAYNKARQLAAANDLSTTKGHAAYTAYFDKANRIYGRGEYEGAAPWFRLAQSVLLTEEVSRKIRDCEINQ